MAEQNEVQMTHDNPKAEAKARMKEVRNASPIREARKAAGLTQTELAKLVGVRQTSVAAVEGRAHPRDSSVNKFLVAINEYQKVAKTQAGA